MTHTKGPWRLGSASAHSGKARIVQLDGRTICRMELDSIEQDARLIAAAPELLETLKVAREILERNGIARHEIAAAIAKAEGR